MFWAFGRNYPALLTAGAASKNPFAAKKLDASIPGFAAADVETYYVS
jgi:hypothetical protein